MNREIEFRAKDNHGKWRHGSYVKFEGLQGAIYYPIRHSEKKDYIIRTEWCYADDETVGQFTGLRDKNGVKIFEGDIVRTNGCEEFFEVIYDAPDFCLKKNSSGYRFLNHPENFEVIGNIHENPELLNRKE